MIRIALAFVLKCIIAVGLLFIVVPLALMAWVPRVVTVAKLTGRCDCSWIEMARMEPFRTSIVSARENIARNHRMLAQEGELGLWDVPGARPFWIRGAFTESNAVAFSEQVADNYRHERVHVRPGDIVLDCGADYGGVTWKALESGASKVVAIEIDPGKIACLNRTFAKEIAAGRVVVVPMGLWDREDTLELDGDSVVMGRTSRKTRVKVDRMDRIVGDLGLPRVDFIAMDIEGAEKPALRGGSETLRRFAPRMAIAAEHLPDDTTAIPALIRELAPGRHEVIGGRCDLVGERIAPTVLFFEPKGS